MSNDKTQPKLSDFERKDMNECLKKAFRYIKKAGLDPSKAQDMMSELNKLNTEANQTTLFG